MFTVVQRGSGQPLHALPDARASDVVGPFWDGEAHILALILSLTPARLEAATARAIERLLFGQWLEARRVAADIEWFWWNASRTRSTTTMVGPG